MIITASYKHYKKRSTVMGIIIQR